MTDTLAMMVHSLPEHGKTELARTGPAPRLILDVDRGTRHIPDRVLWRDLDEAPPEGETVIVPAVNEEKLDAVFQWLESGQHPFRSVIIDTITALQRQLLVELVGTKKPDWDDWGRVLRGIEKHVSNYSGLVEHPKPVEFVLFNAHSKYKFEEDSKGQKTDVVDEIVPYLQGQITEILPWYVDLIGHLYWDRKAGPDRVLILNAPGEGNGKRRFAHLPETIENPNAEELLRLAYERK